MPHHAKSWFASLPAGVTRAGLLTLALSAATDTASAQTAARDLALTSLEDLMQIEITSAGRREQRAVEVAAATYVITQDEIRRSGFRSLPELFRLAPGVQVARLNSNKWAVSIRGFNDVFSNKVLVLVDGRSIYKRTFSGAFWHAEDLMIEDIDHIEIIRGPGGATWGANAVNGVINIITRSAADTKGGLVRAGAGTTVNSEGAARYGGRLKGVDYRVFGLWTDYGPGALAGDDAVRATDTWSSAKLGFRADWSRGRHAAMLQGGLLDGQSHALWVTRTAEPGSASSIDPSQSNNRAGDLQARWTYAFNPGTSLEVQSFYSRQNLREPVIAEIETVGDVDAIYRTRAGRHDLVGGAGYRQVHRRANAGSPTLSLEHPREDAQVWNVFLQDEVALGRRVKATLGAKFEHDSAAGANVQPIGRVIWEVAPDRQFVWGAVARAVRTPSPVELGVRANVASLIGPGGVPITVVLVGNPDYETETFVNAEAGYRRRLGSAAAFNVSVFRGDYGGLPTQEPLEPVFEATPPHLVMRVRYENRLEVKTTGVEAGVELRPGTTWRIEASFSGFDFDPRPDPTSQDAAAATFDASSPGHQWQVRGSYALGPRSELSAGLFHVGRLRVLAIPAYTRVDARFAHQLGGGLSVNAVGQNLFDGAHPEFATPALTATQIRRTVHLRLEWRF